jgi:hypothetical protein
MSDGGKGSAPRPFSVDRETYENNWDRIFKKKEWDHYSDLPNPDAYKNDYQDILSTEDCVLDALEDIRRDGC